MIRETFKKSDYTPIKKIGDNKYHIMWDKVDVVNIEYQLNEDGSRTLDDNGNPIVVNQIETEYCTCTHDIVCTATVTGIYNIIKQGKQRGYNLPSVEEYAEYVKTLNGPIKQLKSFIKEKITDYDNSSTINLFTIGDAKVWLDKATRVGLKLRFESEKVTGATQTTLWYNGMSFTLNIDDAIAMLYAIEMYASACYDNTQKHISNIDTIETIDELIVYDYTSGYPEQLTF